MSEIEKARETQCYPAQFEIVSGPCPLNVSESLDFAAWCVVEVKRVCFFFGQNCHGFRNNCAVRLSEVCEDPIL